METTAGAARVCSRTWHIDAHALVVEKAESHSAFIMQSPLAKHLTIKQWGVAYGRRWGHCNRCGYCLAYASAVTVAGSQGGGPCTTCGCYPAEHIGLGRYPTRCGVPGCSCGEFQPECCPVAMPGAGRFMQAHDNAICGVCGHASTEHTHPYDHW